MYSAASVTRDVSFGELISADSPSRFLSTEILQSSDEAAVVGGENQRDNKRGTGTSSQVVTKQEHVCVRLYEACQR